jgi:hypothetical protein
MVLARRILYGQQDGSKWMMMMMMMMMMMFDEHQ